MGLYLGWRLALRGEVPTPVATQPTAVAVETELDGAGDTLPAAPAPPSATAPSAVAVEPPGRGVRIAIVIDDLGRRVEDVEALAALGVPLTYSVLPFEPRTAEVVAELEERGFEYLCHLPMQAAGGADPGPGALRTEMSGRQLASGTRAALNAVVGAVGVNNHMGSDLSADGRAMRAVLRVLERRGLYFLDSRTGAASVGYQIARELGIPAAERHVFLDAESGERQAETQFRRLLEVAAERGTAVAIGHPKEATLAVLLRAVPAAVEAGYEFVPLSYLLDRPHGEL